MISRPQLLVALPAAIGGVVAAGIGAGLFWPQWQQQQLGRSRVAELRQIELQLPLMAQQLRREQAGVVQARRQQGVVLQLIAGSGSFTTFLAQLDRLAALSGVTVSLYEPMAAAAPAADPNASGQPKPAPKALPSSADPLLGAPGVTKQEVLLRAAGPYPALLAFMRQLEMLRVLVVQRNLQLAVEEQKGQAPPAKAPQAPAAVQLKMTVATYQHAPP